MTYMLHGKAQVSFWKLCEQIFNSNEPCNRLYRRHTFFVVHLTFIFLNKYFSINFKLGLIVVKALFELAMKC